MFVLNRKDVQGLVVSSYKRLHCAAFLLLHIQDSAGAKRWLSQHLAEITTSEGSQPSVSTNLAFTCDGVKALGLKDNVIATFSRPFQEGMATDHRSRILGDADENAPQKWDWGRPDAGEADRVDALLLIYGSDENVLNAQLEERKQQLSLSGISIVRALPAQRQPDNHEHFGFNDGIGQPVMEGTGNKQRQLERTNHATELPAGEFLMGQTNVYGVIADGPVVSKADDPGNLLPDVPVDTTGLQGRMGMRDLGCNGSYLVFRQLDQHVGDFWQFLDNAAKGDAAERERLGAKFVGRWKSGAPLVLSPDADNPDLGSENNFSYLSKDPHGHSCPIGSHIRRSNPRDSLGPDSATALNSAKRHRILRRGRSYGQRLENLLADDGKQRGLHFICLNSDIERQFEFVQQTWINNPVFGGLDGEVDPLVGNLPKGDCIFTVQAQPLRTRVHGLSRFVIVRGGAYFFLPSMSALRYLASL